MDGAALAALVRRHAPDHAAHKHEAAPSRSSDVIDVRCSCGVGLSFPTGHVTPEDSVPNVAAAMRDAMKLAVERNPPPEDDDGP